MFDVIIIGSGPSGMMAAINASKNNERVLLLEKNDKLGVKLGLTGGGRCNVTNMKSIEEFIKQIPTNSKFLYSCLNQFGPKDIYSFFSELGVSLKEEDNNRVFPTTNKAWTIIEALIKEMRRNDVTIKTNETVLNINLNGDIKEVTTANGTYQAKRLIIATGGASYPKTGTTGDGYNFANAIGQPVTELYPAETFLNGKDSLPLMGISIDNVFVRVNDDIENGSLLFTHFGLSGPAVFKISEKVYKLLKNNKIVDIYIDLIPSYSEDKLIRLLNDYNQKREVSSFIKDYLPKRLVDYITRDISNVKIGDLSKIRKNELINNLKNFNVKVVGTGSIDQSFVTGGGVDLKYINPKTMESTINKGVYFIGEVLDIHGHTGGYNITIALSTGYAAGRENL